MIGVRYLCPVYWRRYLTPHFFLFLRGGRNMRNKTKVEIFSHFVKLTDILPHHRGNINFYLKNFLWEHKTERTRDGRYEKVYGKMYAAATDDRSELRLHRNCWDDFLNRSGINQNELEIEKKEIPKGIECSFRVPEGFKLRDYQEEIINTINSRSLRTEVIELSPGLGKGLSLDTLIKVPNGWEKISDIVPGSDVVMPNGDIARVKGVYNNTNLRCFKITFVDGRNVVCDESHRWTIYSKHLNRKGDFSLKTLNTLELKDHFDHVKSTKDGHRCSRIRIPLVDPTHTMEEDVNLPLDPYVLGVILGDGGIENNGCVTIVKSDSVLFDEIEKALSGSNFSLGKIGSQRRSEKNQMLLYGSILSNGENKHEFRNIMCHLDLAGKRAWEKSIPDIYMCGSFNQRLYLLQGLLDTDGHVGKPENSIGCNGKRGNGAGIEFSTTSEILASQTVELARSVGCIAKIKQRQTYFTHNGERKPGRISWRVNIRAQIPSMLFRSITKKRCCVDANQYAVHGLKLSIKDIEEIPSVPTRCLSVDHEDEMFVIQDYIVTHNTATSLNFISSFKKRLGIVVLGRYTDRWWQDVEQYAFKEEILEIRGTKELVMTIESIYDNPDYLKDIKIIMITTTTLQDYISYYNKAKPEERKNLLPPEEIWDVLGIGIKLCDEAHQHFHANFMIDLYTHIEKEIFLSGTLNIADSFMKRMYDILYPTKYRLGGGLQKKYTDCTSVRYRFQEPFRIKCRNQKKMYNHTRFEKWLMSSPKLYKRYFEIVVDPILKSDFLPRREGKYKALIFFATKKMCQLYVDHLKSKFKGLDVRRYISEDSYDNLLKADIAVSTLGSAGTAVDVKDLITCIMTTALKSEQANLQALGRLREIPDVKTEFFYLVCDDIDKHKSYHETKKFLFKDWVRSHNDYYVGERI